MNMKRNPLFDEFTGRCRPRYFVVDSKGLILAKAATKAEAERKRMICGEGQVMRQDNLFQEGGRI